MADYLVTQAIRSFWCTPDQDNQVIIAPRKITLYGGVYTDSGVMWRRYKLPVMGERFHIYDLSGIYPQLLGMAMPSAYGIWYKVSDVCRSERLIVDLYSAKGIQMPRHTSWYMVTHDHELILAVQEQPLIPINLNEETLYFRVYSNAYYNSNRVDALHEFIDVQGKTIRSSDDLLAIQHLYDAAKTRIGETYAFVNGYRVSGVDFFTATIGDVVEFVYDGSIYSVIDFPLKDLPTFNSTMDQKYKYLLHTPNGNFANIDYQDDIDFFLYQPTSQNRFKGVYYHRIQPDAIRQVTHKDYSVPVQYLVAYQDFNPEWTDVNNLILRAHIRKSGYDRVLPNEANRIKELYKLPDPEIAAAIVGVDSVVPEWQADRLENSAYTKVMRSQVLNITPQLVQQAYGYNAISQLLAPSPLFTKNVSNQLLVDLPINLQSRSTLYEYSFEGYLTNWQKHAYGPGYVAKGTDTHLVEALTGYGVVALDEQYGKQFVQIDPSLDYRMYVCNVVGGLPDNIWRDVTNDNVSFVITGNQLKWLVDPTLTYTMVRSNRDFLAYDLSLMVTSGLLEFSLTSQQNRGGALVNTVMQVPMGELDLFLNGKALIEDVDYVVNFPKIVITNKKHLVNPESQAQLIHIRFSGHCLSDLTREKIRDVGFITHGVLSNNNRFDIRDDKVLHINVGGAVYDRSELRFAENHSGVNVPGVADGTPYLVRDIVVPMRGSTIGKTYELRAIAQDTDKHVADYMTLKMPPPSFTQPTSIAERYPVYSPFLSSILDDLKTGLLNDSRIYGQYNDNILMDICKPYEEWLMYDQALEEHKADDSFMIVHPYYRDTVISLDLFQYRFMLRVLKFYFNDSVSISHYVTLKS